MERKTIKKIFTGAMIVLVLQYATVGVVGYYASEPWPAFVFPGFKSVYVFDDGFEISAFRFIITAEDSATHKVVTPGELFPEIPESQLPGFIRAQFGNPAKTRVLSEKARFWLKQQAEKAAGFPPAGMDVVEEKEFYSHSGTAAVLDSTREVSRANIFLKADE